MDFRKWDFFPNDSERLGIVTAINADKNGSEFCTIARNVTQERSNPELFRVSSPPGKRSDAWLKNTQENLGDIMHSIQELKPRFEGKDVYIVGAGISAAKYGALLENVNDGIIIAVNDGIRHVPNPYRDNVFFGCMDWLGQKRWLDGLNIEAMRAILCTITARDVWRAHGSHGRHWQESYWFANQCSYEANEFLAQHNKTLPVLDAGFSVIYSILHGLWLWKPRTIVFLGVEGCYTEGFQYQGVPAEWKNGHKWKVLPDISGKPVLSDVIYETTRDLIVGAAYFLRTAGIRLVNAAQCGTLSQELPVPVELTLPDGRQVVRDIKSDIFEQRRLIDVIKELEKTCIEKEVA